MSVPTSADLGSAGQTETVLRLMAGAKERRAADPAIGAQASSSVAGMAGSSLAGLVVGWLPDSLPLLGDVRTSAKEAISSHTTDLAKAALSTAGVEKQADGWLAKIKETITRFISGWSDASKSYMDTLDQFTASSPQWTDGLVASIAHLKISADGKDQPIISAQEVQAAMVAGAKREFTISGIAAGFVTDNRSPAKIAENVYTSVLDRTAQKILTAMPVSERNDLTKQQMAYALALPVAEAASGMRAVAGDGDKVKFEPLEGAPAGALAYFQQGMSGGTATPQFALAKSPALEAQKQALAQAKEQEQQRALALAEEARKKAAAGVKGGEPAAGNQTPTQVTSALEDPVAARVAAK